MKKRETLTGVRKGIVLLEQLAIKKAGMTFNEIKERFPDSPASTISRLLKTLIEEKLVSKNDAERNYRLGERAHVLGSMLCGKLSRAELLRPLVKTLAQTTNQSAAYFELIDNSNTLVVKHEIANAFHYMDEGQNNTNFDHHGCAKILIAYQPPSIIEQLWKQHLSNSDREKKDYLSELGCIRHSDVITNLRDDKSYISRIAAPVFSGNIFAGAIGITILGKCSTKELKTMADKVKNAAMDASKLLLEY